MAPESGSGSPAHRAPVAKSAVNYLTSRRAKMINVLLAYVDESYSTKLYWIAALVVPETELVSLTASLDDVVARAASNYTGIATDAALHGHALFHAKDDWKALATMPRARIGVYHDAFQALAAHNVRVFIRGVNIPRLNERYTWPDHPHSVVLQHL